MIAKSSFRAFPAETKRLYKFEAELNITALNKKSKYPKLSEP